MILWRAPEAKLTDPTAWQGWGWNGRDWNWGRAPSDILPAGTKLGEICLRRIQGNWVMSGFDAGAYNAFVKVGESILSDWTRAPDYRPVKGMATARGGPDIVGRLYGCYTDPNSRFDGAFGMIVSEWQVGDEPYRASQYRIGGIKPVVTPTVEDETSDSGNSPEEWDMATAEEVNKVVSGTVTPGKDYDFGREDGHDDGKRNLFAMVQRALWELTLWASEGSVDELNKLKGKKATLLGLATRAASWGRHNNAKLHDVGFGVLDTQVKLDKVLHNQKAIAAKLGIDPSEIKE